MALALHVHAEQLAQEDQLGIAHLGELLRHGVHRAVVLGDLQRSRFHGPVGHEALLAQEIDHRGDLLLHVRVGEPGAELRSLRAESVLEEPADLVATTALFEVGEERGQGFFVQLRKERLARLGQPIGVRRSTLPTLFAHVLDEPFRLELLEMSANGVRSHTVMLGELLRRERLCAFQREQDLAAKTFVRGERRRQRRHRSKNLAGGNALGN